MKTLAAFVLAALASAAVAQSSLPACTGSDASRWTNCFGTYTAPNGDRSESSGMASSTARALTDLASNKYKGGVFVREYRDNKVNGQGHHTWASGNLYVGEFRDGKPNGQGTHTLANGDKFVGEWRDGKAHGRGITTTSFADDRPPQEGLWENGNFVRAERIPDHIAGRAPSAPPPVAQAPRQAEAPRSALSLAVTPSSPDANGVVTFAIATNSDTASLKINGDEEGGRADGRYSVRRFAQVGENRYEVIATDRFGKTQRQTVSVNREFAQTAPTIPALNPLAVRVAKPRDAVAIVIGIEKYRRVPAADFANRDASIFVDYARRALGIPPKTSAFC